MRGKYFRRIGGFVFAVVMLSGAAFMPTGSTLAQQRRRVEIVPVDRELVYRPFGFGYRSRYDHQYRYYHHYIFRDSEAAVSQAYKDGFSTGKADGKKGKNFDPERSHYYYEAGFGNFGEVYRSGFANGYREGYRVGSNDRAS